MFGVTLVQAGIAKLGFLLVSCVFCCYCLISASNCDVYFWHTVVAEAVAFYGHTVLYIKAFKLARIVIVVATDTICHSVLLLECI